MSRPPPADSSPALRTLTRQPAPEKLQALFNAPEQVRVQALPCALEGLNSKAVHFPAGVRTNPHLHPQGQHIVVTHGVGVGETKPASASYARATSSATRPAPGTGMAPIRPRR